MTLRVLLHRFSLHGEVDGLKPAIEGLEGFVGALPLAGVDNNGSATAGLQAKLPPTAATNAYIAMPYSVFYASLALPAPSFTSEQYPA